VDKGVVDLPPGRAARWAAAQQFKTTSAGSVLIVPSAEVILRSSWGQAVQRLC